MIRKSFLAIALACVAIPAASAPGDMKISTFLTKADGVLALASSDIGLLKAEGKAAGDAYRARIKSDKAKNLPPHSCPPAKASINSDDLLAHFRSYNMIQRQQVSVRTGFVDMMLKRFPCKS
jgi:hypothetical protein